MMMVATATRTFMVMVMMVTATTATGFFFMMMVATATAATFIFVVMVATTAATAFIFVMMAATTTAAATAATTATLLQVKANRHKGFVHFGHIKADHAEHLSDVGHLQNSEAFRSFSNRNAARNQSGSSFLQRAHIARNVQDTFNTRTNHPEFTLVVNENVINVQGTAFFNGDSHRAFGSFKNFRPLSALSRGQYQVMSASQNRLSGLGIGREELRKSRHNEFNPSIDRAKCPKKLSTDCIRIFCTSLG